MANVFDCANFFIANTSKGDMTNLRINKLLYFAQGYHLARTNRRLFENSIEAWTYGPVVTQVYQTFKMHGRDPVSGFYGVYDEGVFDFEEKETMADVCRDFWDIPTCDLVDMSHEEDGPWNNSRIRNASCIEVEEMKKYFTKLRQFDLFESALETNACSPSGYRNGNGVLVLQREDDDDDDWSEYDEM